MQANFIAKNLHNTFDRTWWHQRRCYPTYNGNTFWPSFSVATVCNLLPRTVLKIPTFAVFISALG